MSLITIITIGTLLLGIITMFLLISISVRLSGNIKWSAIFSFLATIFILLNQTADFLNTTGKVVFSNTTIVQDSLTSSSIFSQSMRLAEVFFIFLASLNLILAIRKISNRK